MPPVWRVVYAQIGPVAPAITWSATASGCARSTSETAAPGESRVPGSRAVRPQLPSPVWPAERTGLAGEALRDQHRRRSRHLARYRETSRQFLLAITPRSVRLTPDSALS